MRFLTSPPRYLFFTGKGGVGKTSIASATAVALATPTCRVLLVSTDPASNIAQVFGVTIGNTITPVPEVPGLDALEIDSEQAADAYRNSIIDPVRDLLPAPEIAAITEQLSGSCTTEVAAFNEFTALLTNDAAYQRYDHIIFDTAPTGHTIRLLQLPGSWTGFLDDGKGDASCLGPLAGLDQRRTQYAEAVATLQDLKQTRLILVTRAQPSALQELSRTYRELADIGITASNVVVNAMLPDSVESPALDQAIRRREHHALAAMSGHVADLPRDLIPLRPDNVVGLPALRVLLSEDTVTGTPVEPVDGTPALPMGNLIDSLEQQGHGLIMCMGKGGVGKTTVAAAIAVALAARGHDVHLTTTDPAAHLTDVLPDSVEHLRVTRVDPEQATTEYRQRVMATKGKNLDADAKAHLAEDLLSPCTEEIAVFQQFSRIVLEGRRRFVVVDTAPTGHTLLLLDTAGAYHRDMVRQAGDNLSLHTPLMLLQDPDLTKVLIVTTPEPTPVTEAEHLQIDLLRAGIHPWAWIINNSIAAANPESPLLQQRAHQELGQYLRITELAQRLAAIPMLPTEPVGADALTALSGDPAHT